MTELKAIGLVDMKESDTKTEEKTIKLKQDFKWFLLDEFSKLREGFIPTDNTEEMKEYDSSLEEKNPLINPEEGPILKYYNCYECEKVNHGIPLYQTNSLSDYQRHWISSGHKGPCQPGKADLELYGWKAQDKPWEI